VLLYVGLSTWRVQNYLWATCTCAILSSVYDIFSCWLINRHDFRKKKMIVLKMCFFSLQLLSETFLILTGIQRDIRSVYWSSCKSTCYFCLIWMKLHEISWKLIQCEPDCWMQTDGHTDMTKLIITFQNFVNVPKNCRLQVELLCCSIFTFYTAWWTSL